MYLDIESNTVLSELVDRALTSDGVIVTRAGKAVAELRAVTVEKRVNSNEAMVKWLDDRRITLRDAFEAPNETLAKLRKSY